MMDYPNINSSKVEDEKKWNYIQLPPIPYSEMFESTLLTPRVTRNVLAMRSSLSELLGDLSKLDCLHADSALLSRLLYRNYYRLRRDKGYQFVKMIMQSLNKYLKMDLSQSVENILGSLPTRIGESKVTMLPGSSVFTWLLARIQAFASLFLRIYDLCKEGGLYLFQRLRLGWCSPMLVFTLSIVARIRVIARFLVLRAVSWHSAIVAKIEVFKTTSKDQFKNYPKDLKQWLGGLERMMIEPTAKPKTRLDMVFDLIDLVSDDEENEMRNIFPNEDDDEIKRLFESVTIPERDSTLLISSDEDIGEVVELDRGGIKPSTSRSSGKPQVVTLHSGSSSPECTPSFHRKGLAKRRLLDEDDLVINPLGKKWKKQKKLKKLAAKTNLKKKAKARRQNRELERVNPYWQAPQE